MNFLDMFMFNATGSTAEIASFFSNFGASGDVTTALGTAGIAFKIALGAIMILGAIAMAVWMLRIAVDIVLLVFRGTKVTEGALSKLGTGQADGYASVGAYVKGNIVEIVLMILLIVFLMTGWLFQLIALAVTGFGIIGNKLLGLDIESEISSLDAKAFEDGVKSRRLESLKGEYDEQLSNLTTEVNRLYEYAKNGVPKDDARFVQASRRYTVAMGKLNTLQDPLVQGAENFNLSQSYFMKHKATTGSQVCNTNFLDPAVYKKFAIGTNTRNACS